MKKCVLVMGLLGLIGCSPVVERTELIVKNADTTDVVVFLTLGGVPPADSASWVQNVNGMFGISGSGLVGSFVLKPGETRSYVGSRALQGQFCFNGQAYQCLKDSIYTGSTLMEFCLNNYGTVKNAQETVDISCVAGVSYLGSMDMCGGGVWSANSPGYDTVMHVQNSIFGRNSGRVGVFPVGCDDCTSSDNPPDCVRDKGETPQKYAICQVQRNAKKSGGCVTITYLRKAFVICEEGK